LIGVISKKNEIGVVEEFFQLFKTPWEFYKDDKDYDVVIISRNEVNDEINSKLLLIFGSEPTQFDNNNGFILYKNYNINTLDFGEITLPIYTQISTFKNISYGDAIFKVNSEVIGLEIKRYNQIVLRIGYNLFDEVSYLITMGQPIKKANIPTLENHIALLRKWIIKAGVPLIEFPPIPWDYNFITCLTHDVDFVRIRNHIFDYSIWGFIYRGLFGSLKKLLNGKVSFSCLLQNWKAVLTLPFVYLGLADDCWFQFNNYLKIEKDLKSTYFFIPFKNRTGDKVSSPNASLRAAKYDINNLKELLSNLVSKNVEIGIHGIDAWHDVESGIQEKEKIAEIIGGANLGIRMHWLLHDKQTFHTLEKAGYIWDSSFGYNETIGYRGGTTQVFKPIGARNLLELPMHIQDSALFFPHRMGLSKKQAFRLCKNLINNSSIYGGVLTLNWHQRSLGPERLWGDFYLRLLKELQVRRTWFASASQAVEWFRKRRTVLFKEVRFSGNKLRLSLRSDEVDIQPPLTIRIYRPLSKKLEKNDFSIHMRNYFDMPWNGKREIGISI